MRYLLQGMETRETIDALLAFTKIEAGPKVDAIYYHFVQGCGQSRAAIIYDVNQSKLSEAIATLNAVAGKAERFHELRVHRPETESKLVKRIELMLRGGDSMEDAIARIKQLTLTESTV